MPAFDPKKVLKRISNPLLKEFFAARGELLDVPWDELREHKIDPIYEAWQGLPDQQSKEVLLVFQDVARLANERGMAVLYEELKKTDPERGEELESLNSKHDIALWAFLHSTLAFNNAVLFAHADSLSVGRYWYRRNGLPIEPVSFDPMRLESLESELKTYYDKTQMRGRRCKVEHYSRQDSNDYLFAYIEDHPDGSLEFVEDNDELATRSGRSVFENVFVFNAHEGTLEMFVKGGKKVVYPLTDHVCRGIWGCDLKTNDPNKPSYTLDHLLEINHPLPVSSVSGVIEARVVRMRIAQRGTTGYLEIKANSKATTNDIYRRLERLVQLDRFPLHGTKVLQVTFQLEFDEGHNKQSTMCFDVSVPNSCTLKSKSEKQLKLGERLLKEWGVIRDA